MENRKTEGLAPAVAALGMTSLTTQIILLREFVSVFQGNELVIGVVMAVWMMLTGAGAFMGRFLSPLPLTRGAAGTALVCAGVLPPATVFLLRASRNIVLTAGSMPGILEALWVSAVILAPFCLLSGFLFPFFVRLVSAGGSETGAARVYALEALGSALGGAVFTVALVSFLATFQILFLLAIVDFFVAFTVARRTKNATVSASAIVLAAAAIAGLLRGDADRRTREYLFPGQEIVSFRDTPYGNLTLTRQGGETTFFENCVPVFSTNDVTASEEAVHYCLCQRGSPGGVLLIGGGISGATTEILKYGVREIDYVELNPWVIDLGRRYTTALDDSRITAYGGDARMFVRSARKRYDAAIMNLPDPSTAQINRFYTLEFFGDVKRVLTDSGVVSISLLPASEYQGKEARALSSTLYATLGRVFRHVLIVPGERNYFLASDGMLDIGITRLIEERLVSTVYVNRYYLDDRLIAARSAALTSALDGSAALNRDFTPVCYERQVTYWLSYFGVTSLPWLPAAGLGLVVLILLTRFSAVGAGVFAGGFTASSLEIVLLLSFQVFCGSLFQMTGIVITAFMGGLAAGALLARTRFRHAGLRGFIAVQFALSGLCVLVPVVLYALRSAPASPLLVQCVVTALALCAAVLTGMEFGLAAVVMPGDAAHAASGVYVLDLLGSALGALVVSVYAIPLFGLTSVSILAGACSAAGGFVCIIMRRRFT